jgi:site-specific DNA recombinase
VKRAIGYPRVSSDEQAQDGFGLGVQEDQIRELIAARGWDLKEIIVDDFTGRTLDRPGFARVRQLAVARAFDVLVVARVDRLARRSYLRRLAEVELEQHGVEVIYATQHFDNNATGRFQKGVMSEVAELESELIAERTHGGRVQKAQGKNGVAAMPVGCKLFGYRQISRAEATAIPEYYGRSGELLIVPEKEAFIREMFERAAAGQSLRSLAAWADTVQPKKGAWSATTIRQMLRNPAYYGLAAFGRRKIIQLQKLTKSGAHLRTEQNWRPEEEWVRVPCPAIVSRALWDQVQERLATNKSALAGRPSKAWPLSSGVTRCGACGGMRGEGLSCHGHKNTRGYRYYGCSSDVRRDLPTCGIQFPADRLEAMAKDDIRRALAPGRLAALAREEAERANEAAGNPEQREKAIRAQLRALDEETESIFERAKLGFDPAFIQKKVADINDRRGELEAQLATARAQAATLRDPDQAAREADEVVAELAGDLEAALADPVRFKELARLLLHIRIFPDGKEPERLVKVPPSLGGVA